MKKTVKVETGQKGANSLDEWRNLLKNMMVICVFDVCVCYFCCWWLLLLMLLLLLSDCLLGNEKNWNIQAF